MTKKKAKILERWSSEKVQEEAQLKLDLSAAELQSKADLYQAEKDLLDAEREHNTITASLENAFNKKGEDWSPAIIVDLQNELEDANALVKERKANIAKMKKLIAEWL